MLSGPFSALRFEPANEDLLVVEGDVVVVNSVHFIAGLKLLRSEMHSVVKLPRGRIMQVPDSLIRRIVASLGDQVANYDSALAHRFHELPWSTGSKASIKQYKDMVGGARNHPFQEERRITRSSMRTRS